MSVEYIRRPGKPVFRHGRRIEMDELVPVTSPGRQKPRRKTFEVDFVQVPKRWIVALSQTQNAAAWRLAVAILAEDFKRKHLGGEIILSSHMTGMSQTTRRRATQELVSLKLIQLEPSSNENGAPRCRLLKAPK
jgi:hypothetical protein